MTTKVFIGPIIGYATDQITGNLLLTYQTYIIGPEIYTLYSGQARSITDQCIINIDGTETLTALATKLTDCALACVLAVFGGNITVARNNVYLPSYVKGV